MTLPLIHLNGTSKETLAEGYDNAACKLREFIDAWEGVEFNARDYYPQGPEAWNEALAKREEMNAKIVEVLEYLTDHREVIHA